MDSSSEIKEGLVGWFDILGYTSLLRNPDLNYVVKLIQKSLSASSEALRQWVDSIVKLVPDGKARGWAQEATNVTSVIVFADTILVTLPVLKTDSVEQKLVKWGMFFEQAVILHFDLFREGLPIRGAISFGEYYVSERPLIFAGKPILRAHEIANSQDWSGSVLALEAETEFENLEKSSPSFGKLLRPYTIRCSPPLKTDHVGQMLCLNWPKVFTEDAIRNINIREAVVAMFGKHNKAIRSVDQPKIDNTETFIVRSKQKRAESESTTAP
jgi:hypothetical protein